ncbi:conserved oligomeric Golgi complex subunit 2 isoform X1 [Rhea pennata]|uniref:conserved oligomeric Golgi complex subunit 2 isoform X1 n=1 Tax=Rhea pennata TaxID=8795 RepID=UPI002E271F83
MEGKKMNLPRGPENLCFDKDEFMKPDFDVDHFVSDCRKRVQLEELREDLELYYKLLKTAMVELINKDYADFVNLSTNLVGMDKALNQLSVPLGQLREEVMSLKSCVSEGIQAVDDRMSKQEDIRRKKMCVLRLIHVIQSVEKIEKILHSQSTKEFSLLEGNSPLLTGQVLERIATEFNQLQFHAVQSKGMPLLDKVRPRIAGITAMLQQSLEGLLLEGLQTSNVDIIRHCLRTYATIDKTRDAEALVGQVLVKPYVDEVIVEQYVQSHPNGLQAMYNKLLEFVPHHCRLLREVTGGAISRFREVAGALEAALSDTLEEAPAGSSYCLLATHMVWMSLQKCWSDQMFLPLLAHRLWKLSLQILARYSVFISEVYVRPISSENMKESKKPMTAGRKESSVNLNPSEDQGNGSSPEIQPLPSITSTQLVYVAADLDKLQDQIPDILEMIKPRLEMIGFKNISCIAGALEDSKASLSACMPTLNNRIIQDLSESSFTYLKSALEVPRLYRRTNKDVPTKASSYVDSALKPFYRLQNEYKDILKQPMIHQWLEGALSESTQKYCETVSDVLSSVKKMEESLKRLKQARKTASPSPVGTNGGMSDDDKIRLQLALDVEYFGDQIQKMGLQTSNIKGFSALTELVLTAKDQTTLEQS